MYQLEVKRYQWLLEVLAGGLIIIPLILFIVGGFSRGAVYISIGAGLMYVLHVTEKMLIFSDMLSKTAESEVRKHVSEQKGEVEQRAEEAQEVIERRAEEKVKEKTQEEVEQKVNEEVEQKVEEKVDEKMDEQSTN